MNQNQELFGQWIGKTFPDEGPPNDSVLNIDAVSPDIGQVIGIDTSSGHHFRTVSYVTIKREG